MRLVKSTSNHEYMHSLRYASIVVSWWKWPFGTGEH